MSDKSHVLLAGACCALPLLWGCPAEPQTPSAAETSKKKQGPATIAPDAAPQADGPFRPINGKDLSNWSHDDVERPNRWVVGKARLDPQNSTRLHAEPGGDELVVPSGEKSTCLYTKRRFGDVHVAIEVLLPAASNGGIFLMGEYELQASDDTPNSKRNPGLMDFGALSRVHAPKVQAMKPAGQWQKYEITFRAPRFDASGRKVKNALFEKVVLNGQVIHENAEVPEPGYGCLTGEEHPTGPLYLQGNEGPVAYRNIVITPLESE